MKKKILNILHIFKMYLYNSKRINHAFKNSNTSKKRIILIGSPEHQNIGDHAISIAENKFFNDYFSEYKIIEITGNMYRNAKRHLIKKSSILDIIAITGGGLMGDLWPEEEEMIENILNDFSDNRIIIMPQTIYFSKGIANNLKIKINNCKNLKILCRDEKTYEFSKSILNADAYLFPDMVLYFNIENSSKSRKDIAICFRNDKESILKNKADIISILEKKMNVKYISTVHKSHISVETREKEFDNILRIISASKLLVTDRLHAVLFAYITKTPCIAFDNVSKKISGVCKWIENCEYIKIVETNDDFDTVLNNMLLNDTSESSETMKKKFEEMAQFIRRYICTHI